MSLDNSGRQQIVWAGSRVYIKRDPIASVDQPWLDIGTVDPVNPETTVTRSQLMDSWGGTKRKVAERVTSVDLVSTIQAYNFSMQNMAMMFSASPPTELTQAVTAQEDVADVAHNGGLLLLRDEAGNRVYKVNTLDEIIKTTGSVALVLGTDYAWENKDQGIIRILSTSTVIATASEPAGTPITYSLTPFAISGKRLISPITNTAIKASVEVWWSDSDFTNMWVWSFRADVSGDAQGWNADDPSNFRMRIAVIGDITSTTTPFGQLAMPVGTLPSITA